MQATLPGVYHAYEEKLTPALTFTLSMTTASFTKSVVS